MTKVISRKKRQRNEAEVDGAPAGDGDFVVSGASQAGDAQTATEGRGLETSDAEMPPEASPSKAESATVEAQSDVDIAREKVQRIEGELAEARRRVEHWRREHVKARQALDDRVLSGEGGRRLAGAVVEGEAGERVWSNRVTELEALLSEAQRELGERKAAELRARAWALIEQFQNFDQALDAEMIEAITDWWQRRLEKADEVSEAVSRFNAKRHYGDLPEITYVDPLRGTDVTSWIDGLLAVTIADGRLRLA